MSELPDSPSEAANIAGEGGDLTLEEAERLVVEVELELAAIDRALGRVDSRTYGNCTVCGATIPPELLVSEPTAERCGEHRLSSESPRLFPR